MRFNPSVLTPVFSSLCCCATYLAAGGGGLYLVEHLEVKKDRTWRSLGVTSVRVRRGSTVGSRMIQGMDLGSDYVAVKTVHEWDGMRVTLANASQEKVLELDRNFLRSGERKVTRFMDADGCEYRITHWGERNCNDPEEVPPLRVIRSTRTQEPAQAAAS